MNISSLSNSYGSLLTQPAASSQETDETKKSARPKETTAAQSTEKPTAKQQAVQASASVNFSGHTVGQVVNVKA